MAHFGTPPEENIMDITNKNVDKLRVIKRKCLGKTSIPEIDNWKKLSNNDIWLRVIRQVIVVGNSDPVGKFDNDRDLQKRVRYERLAKIKTQSQLEKDVNSVLRAVGARFASRSVKKCRKTQALVHNLKVFRGWKDGPKSLLMRLSEFEGQNATKRKVRYLMKIFKFIKSKSARDYLTGLGLINDAIAIDVRIQNVLRQKIGIRIPDGLENNSKLYDGIEKELLEKLCKPLKMSGVQFDKMIYQNYDEIKQMKFH